MGLRLQEKLVALRKEGRVSDVLLLLEHPPVITLGRNAKSANVVAAPEVLTSRGVEVHECDRGGDVTFHGPGQLVAYPIFDLRGFPSASATRKTLGAVEFVRRMEEVLIRTCGDLGVVTERIPGLAGVWTQNEVPGKIAAVGVHISRAVTSHGFALNVSTNLDYFKLIVPCGIADKPVTTLAQEMEQSSLSRERTIPGLEELAQQVARNFGRVFEAQTLWLESLEALLASPQPGPTNEDIPARAPEKIRKLAGDDDVYMA